MEDPVGAVALFDDPDAAPRLHVPHPRRVTSRRDDAAAVGAEQRLYGPAMLVLLEQRLPAGEIPESEAAVAAAHQGALAVRGEAERVDGGGVLDAPRALAGGYVPHQQPAVVASGHQALTVLGQPHGGDVPLVSLLPEDPLRVRQTPDADHAIERARGQASAGPVEVQADHRAGLPRQSSDGLRARGGPHPHAAVTEARHDVGAVGRVLDPPGPPRTQAQQLHLAPRLDLPHPQRLVLGHGRNVVAVRAEAGRQDLALVANELHDELAQGVGRRLPGPQPTIAALGGACAPVLGQGVELVGVRERRGQKRPVAGLLSVELPGGRAVVPVQLVVQLLEDGGRSAMQECAPATERLAQQPQRHRPHPGAGGVLHAQIGGHPLHGRVEVG